MNSGMINPQQFQTQDLQNFMEFWQLYNYPIGNKFVRVAKRILKSKNINTRKKSHTPINSNTIKFQEFEELDSRDKIIKFYLHYRDEIKINDGLLKHLDLPIISKEPLIIEELSKTKPRYNVYQKELQQKEKNEF